jgi:ubiquinone/menaquinone biosynthesis C-methylase UbiE
VTNPDVNHWLDDRCAEAFWDQCQAVPYKELLRDTAALLDPKPGETWLDLGCGSGLLTREVWRASEGRVGRVVAVDCAAANAGAIDRLRARLEPAPRPGQVEFRCANFSNGLDGFETASADGIVSGLAISYAEHRDPATGRYTDRAYNRLLAEMARVLRPGGRLVVSVNVPQPDFWRIVWRSLRRSWRLSKPGRILRNTWRMQRYGRWLKREAGRGRFHFLPLPELLARLRAAGFGDCRYQLSYADQAYLVRAEKPAADVARVA